MTRQHAERLLRPFGLDKDGPDRAFKRAAQKYHPDKGGTDTAFIRLTEARDLLKREPRSRPRPEPFGFGPGFERHRAAYRGIFVETDMTDWMNKILAVWREANARVQKDNES